MTKTHRLENKRINLSKALAEFTEYSSIANPTKVERAETIRHIALFHYFFESCN